MPLRQLTLVYLCLRMCPGESSEFAEHADDLPMEIIQSIHPIYTPLPSQLFLPSAVCQYLLVFKHRQPKPSGN